MDQSSGTAPSESSLPLGPASHGYEVYLPHAVVRTRIAEPGGPNEMVVTWVLPELLASEIIPKLGAHGAHTPNASALLPKDALCLLARSSIPGHVFINRAASDGTEGVLLGTALLAQPFGESCVVLPPPFPPITADAKVQAAWPYSFLATVGAAVELLPSWRKWAAGAAVDMERLTRAAGVTVRPAATVLLMKPPGPGTTLRCDLTEVRIVPLTTSDSMPAILNASAQLGFTTALFFDRAVDYPEVRTCRGVPYAAFEANLRNLPGLLWVHHHAD